MNKKILSIILLILFVLILTPFIFSEEQIKLTCMENKEITINIDMNKGEAVMYLMGNHMFKMSARYLPIKGAPEDNLIELQGNGFRKIHLNKSRKILYFREGNEGEFANVSIEEKSKNQLQVKCLSNKDIEMNISMDKSEAVMYLLGNHMFKMDAKYYPIKGAPPDNLIELKGDGFRKMYLNKSRKILIFTDGSKGTFSKIEFKWI